MKIKIYQIDTARDKNRVKFMGLKELSKYRGRSEIDASLYNEVFSGEVDCKDLEEVYEMFNLEPHPLHRGAFFVDVGRGGNGHGSVLLRPGRL